MDVEYLAALAAARTEGGVPGAHPSAGLSLSKVPVIRGEPLRLEIESFLDSVRTGSTPVVTGEDGREALALALQITAAMAQHAERTGLLPYRE